MAAPLACLPAHDAATVTRLVDFALAAGYAVSVSDGEEFTLRRCTDRAAILAAIGTTDADTLVFRDATGARIGSTWLIWGNGPGETIADHTDNVATCQLVAAANADPFSHYMRRT